MAYSSDFDSHILNMTPENMSADIFDDAHFVDWIAMHFPQFCGIVIRRAGCIGNISILFAT